MEFTFPNNITLHYGVPKKFKRQGQFFQSENIDIQQPIENVIEIDKVTYFFTYLQGADPGNKGGNSIILKLYVAEKIDTVNPEYEEPDQILKISKSPKASKARFVSKSERRFIKEIEALKACNDAEFQNVIKIFHTGICKIFNTRDGKFDQHLYYTMEPADHDLKSYIEINHDQMDIEEKVRLCLSLSEGLRELRSLGYYHRDIKPDNVFMVNDIWKIGDLGLIVERGKFDEIDTVGDAIGPRGWMSPESMNKYLCEGKNFQFDHNYFIDHQSDIFQLGKVFWYILQHNAPIGAIKEKDFLVKNSSLYAIIKTMLSHSKKRRYKNIEEVIKLLKIIEQRVLKNIAA